MNPLCHNVHPANHFIRTRAGRTGAVGSTQVRPKGRQSNPDKPPVFVPYYAGNRGNTLGSNIQDGDDISYGSRGGQPKLSYGRFVGNRGFKHQYGYRFHSIVPENPTAEARPNSLGPLSWRLKVARCRSVLTKGNKFFSVIPGPYELPPGQVPRGGLTPRTLTLQDDSNNQIVDVHTGAEVPRAPVNVNKLR
jgi:hypothetical protein